MRDYAWGRAIRNLSHEPCIERFTWHIRLYRIRSRRPRQPISPSALLPRRTASQAVIASFLAHLRPVTETVSRRGVMSFGL